MCKSAQNRLSVFPLHESISSRLKRLFVQYLLASVGTIGAFLVCLQVLYYLHKNGIGTRFALKGNRCTVSAGKSLPFAGEYITSLCRIASD